MKVHVLLPFAACAIAVVAATGGPATAAGAQTAGRGAIKGHIHLTGKQPGNPIIRMGMDPMCAKINAGKRVIQETVLASADDSLANVFVRLQGSLPPTPVPATPVTIDQRGCVYGPRVVGVRVGQVLQIRNDDELMHNVHSSSARGNSFNVSEPKAGMVQQFRMKDEEIMLRIKCDIHSWMVAFAGVVTNPYFAVSNAAGTFEIDNVPPGTYTVQAWHEQDVRTTRTRCATGGGAGPPPDSTKPGAEPPGAGD